MPPHHSSNRHHLLVPRSRTAMSESRSLASIGPSFCDALLSPFVLLYTSIWIFLFFSNPASSVSILHTASASLWFFLHGALYVWIQYIWLIWACLDGFRKLKLLSAFVLLQQTGKYSIQKTILPDYLYSTVLAEAVRWELLSILSAMDVPLPNRRWSLLYVFN